MACTINCGFAQVAVYTALQKLSLPNHGLPPNANTVLLEEYRKQFQGTRQMLPRPGTEKHFAQKSRILKACFSRRWNPSERKDEYVRAFSTTAWEKLPLEKKQKHTRKDCQACNNDYSVQIATFPTTSRALKRENPVSEAVETQTKQIKLSQERCPKLTKGANGNTILKNLNPLCEKAVGAPLEKVLASTPKSNLQIKVTSQEQKRKRRKTAQNMKEQMERHFAQTDYQMVYGNHLSHAKYNRIRLTEAFETRDEARKRTATQKDKQSVKVHGYATHNHPINGEQLLHEATMWTPDAKINWSELGEKVGLTCANRGQVVKEYLANEGIPIAQQKRTVIRRAKRKLPGGEISYPAHGTVTVVKATPAEKIDAGEINPGEQIAPREYLVYRFQREDKKIIESKVMLHGRKITLHDICKKLLAKHCSMGIVRCQSNEDTDSLSNAQLKEKLENVGMEIPQDVTRESLVECLESNVTKRFLKVWHDHGKIAGQGHFLVLVSCIYDPLFFFTTQEMATKAVDVDVPTVVEEPEIHILSRSGSSDVEQALYNQDRFVDVQTLGVSLNTPDEIPINDTLRFFHGDHPAAEYEAGQNRSGYYTCPTCPAHTLRFDDLIYCFRCPNVTLATQQEFPLGSPTGRMG